MSTSLMGSSGYKGPTGKASGLKGTGYQQVTSQNFTPEQMNLFQQLFGQVGPDSYLSKLAGGDQSQFEQVEAPALRQFNQLQGGLASRFSGMGSMGARKSSGFQNASNSAASNFAEQLQGQRMGIQQQAIRDLMGMSESLLGQRPYETNFVPKQPKDKPFWQELMLSLAPGASSFGSMAGLGGIFGSKIFGGG